MQETSKREHEGPYAILNSSAGYDFSSFPLRAVAPFPTPFVDHVGQGTTRPTTAAYSSTP